MAQSNARILVIYNQPADPAAFDTYYHETHLPLAYKIPGLRSMTVSATPPQALTGAAAHLVAELNFDSMADLQAAMASPEGQATAADVANFGSAGYTLLVYEPVAKV
jgi:uncharacterized protein (TIGR02118 family)